MTYVNEDRINKCKLCISQFILHKYLFNIEFDRLISLIETVEIFDFSPYYF